MYSSPLVSSLCNFNVIMLRHFYILLPSAIFSISAAFQPCTILGPIFPPPTNLASSARLQDAFTNLTEAITEGLATGNSLHGPVINSTAYAIQLFSVNDAKKPLYEIYYAGELLVNSSGAEVPAGDSVFRIGSVSKLLEVYTMLAEIGDKYWDQPVTKYIPELRSHVNKSESDPIDYVAWDQITLGALGGQVTGITRDRTFSFLFPFNNSDN